MTMAFINELLKYKGVSLLRFLGILNIILSKRKNPFDTWYPESFNYDNLIYESLLGIPN